MDNITLPAWVGKALYAVGIAAVLGAGGKVIGNAEDVAVLKHSETTNTQRLERIENKLDRLIEKDDTHVHGS